VIQLKNAYDSHVHWLATGAWARRLNLKSLKSAEDILKIKHKPEHKRGDWLLGFGWDQNTWADQNFPTRELLDRAFPGVPVFFSRADGHAFWVSTVALKRADLFHKNAQAPEGGKILKGEDGYPSGVLIDLAGSAVENLIPKADINECIRDLKAAIEIFNQAGFTHIRDMSCDEAQWNASVTLYDRGELSLAVEQCFSADHPNDFHKALNLALRARQKYPKLIRPHAVKIYFDGALGSEGALLSKPYPSGSGQGLQLLERIALKDMIREVWQHNFAVAVHAIGDEACHQVASVAHELWEMGEDGDLHIEHAQVMRPETIQLLKGRRAFCHMQPCHFLSDQFWLKEKLGTLYEYAFPWRALEDLEIRFDFGSDSPIEVPSIKNNVEALKEAASHDIQNIKKPWANYHSHPDTTWTPNTFTEFSQDFKVQRVSFFGKELLQ
jgi:predicted amidohydrolase YtcJ